MPSVVVRGCLRCESSHGSRGRLRLEDVSFLSSSHRLGASLTSLTIQRHASLDSIPRVGLSDCSSRIDLRAEGPLARHIPRLFIAFLFALPIGMIQAVTNQGGALNVISELIMYA